MRGVEQGRADGSWSLSERRSHVSDTISQWSRHSCHGAAIFGRAGESGGKLCLFGRAHTTTVRVRAARVRPV